MTQRLLSIAVGLFIIGAALQAEPPGPRPARVAEDGVPPPQFTEPDRVTRLEAALPEVGRALRAYAAQAHMPGAAFGVIIDGTLVWSDAVGVLDVETQTPVDADSVFRIASMTKSFTAAAILRLRDEGRLSLEDRVDKYVPEIASLPYPTRDAPLLTIRHLLSHSEGLPEDNAWGDRQLAIPQETMTDWVRAGIPFSTVPGTAYEYSNYGFALLGRIVSTVAGTPYDEYVTRTFLQPLGMTSTTFHRAAVPTAHLAKGYRYRQDAWQAEPILEHGAFGAMGGLWTSTKDLARWVAFMLDAWPPRNDPDTSPLARASRREMQQIARARPAQVTRARTDAGLRLVADGYGYGLRISQDCNIAHSVAHGGGLPGYGSLMTWLPEYGVGLIAVGNVTYASWGPAFAAALDAFQRTGALRPRRVQPAAVLVTRANTVSRAMGTWDLPALSGLVADNFFLDTSTADWTARFRALEARHGHCTTELADFEPENALRGTWHLQCDRGRVRVAMTLAPTPDAAVQSLSLRSVLPPDAAMQHAVERVLRLASTWNDAEAASLLTAPADTADVRAQLQALNAAWGTCRAGEAVDGDGTTTSTVTLTCAHGLAELAIGRTAGSERLTALQVAPSRSGVVGACVP